MLLFPTMNDPRGGAFLGTDVREPGPPRSGPWKIFSDVGCYVRKSREMRLDEKRSTVRTIQVADCNIDWKFPSYAVMHDTCQIRASPRAPVKMVREGNEKRMLQSKNKNGIGIHNLRRRLYIVINPTIHNLCFPEQSICSAAKQKSES